jgi:hypothetical protein
VLLKALAKDARDRYATASEFLRALDQCLPAQQRANTDEDVGNYVRSLFGTKREESRAALADALALADRQGARLLSASEGAGNSSVSAVTDMGFRDAHSNADSTFTSIAPTAADAGAKQRRQRAWALASAAVLLLIAVALLVVFRAEPSTEPRPAASEQPKRVDPVPSSVRELVPAEGVDPLVLPLEPASNGTRAVPPPNAARVLGAKPTPPGSAAPAGSARAPKPAAPKWRQDPGF